MEMRGFDDWSVDAGGQIWKSDSYYTCRSGGLPYENFHCDLSDTPPSF
jgi:hypothetical protein